MRNSNTVYEYNVVELFELQVIQTPLHIAISENGKHYTYNTLNEKSNQFAYCLKKNDVKPGEFISVLLEPGIDFVISILAIIKLGAVYLPLDALAPKRRLEEILEDAKPKLVITDKKYRSLINENKNELHLVNNLSTESSTYPRENLPISCTPLSPLYMMYTSGSTGKPKGVIVPHRAVVHLVKTQNDFQIQVADRIGQFSNLAFDGSPYELWSALLNGANLNIIPLKIRTNPTLLKNFLEEHQVHYLCLPTGFFHQLIKSAANTLNHIRVISFG